MVLVVLPQLPKGAANAQKTQHQHRPNVRVQRRDAVFAVGGDAAAPENHRPPNQQPELNNVADDGHAQSRGEPIAAENKTRHCNEREGEGDGAVDDRPLGQRRLAVAQRLAPKYSAENNAREEKRKGAACKNATVQASTGTRRPKRIFWVHALHFAVSQ